MQIYALPASGTVLENPADRCQIITLTEPGSLIRRPTRVELSTSSHFIRKTAMLEQTLRHLFAATVEVVGHRGSGNPEDLLPEEASYVSRAVAKRVAEFAAGRACARAALAKLGHPGVAIPAAVDRSPIWPGGIVGTITHTTGWCAAAVAHRRDFIALGLDSEVIGAAGADLWPTICCEVEAAWVRSLPAARQPAAATLLFSAKEAFYKCQYPVTGEWLDFHDLTLDIPHFGVEGAFYVRPNRPLLIQNHVASTLSGRFLLHDQWLSTACAIPTQSG